jgi:hypothetical protein
MGGSSITRLALFVRSECAPVSHRRILEKSARIMIFKDFSRNELSGAFTGGHTGAMLPTWHPPKRRTGKPM